MMNSLRITIIGAIMLLAACATATDGPGAKTEETTDPRPVDARTDNAQVLAQASLGLIVTLHIEGDIIRSYDTQIAAVTATSQAKGDSISITALRNGDRIATMSVADQQVNAQEEVGLVKVESRTLIGTIQLPQRVDTLLVESPMLKDAKELDVRKVFDVFCEQYRNQSICVDQSK